MVKVSPDELRDFSGALHPADFKQVIGDMLAIDLYSPLVPATGAPNGFLREWSGATTGFAKDLLRGIELFGTVARQAADQYGTADQTAALLMERDGHADRRPSQEGDLPRKPGESDAPVNLPDPANLPNEPKDRV